MTHNMLTPFAEILSAFQQGKMIILVDDKDRENEGDLCMAAQFCTSASIQFMAVNGRGLICVTISQELAERLQLPAQAKNNNSPFHTPFTVPVDHVSVAQFGALAEARAKTIQSIINPRTVAADLTSPGSMFPLVANPAGVIGRQGQTEGSYDLARLAGLFPAGVICEILDEDGTMLRGKRLFDYATKHQLPITSVQEIIKARIQGEILVRSIASSSVTTAFGVFQATVFQDDVTNKEHIALVYGDTSKCSSVLTRIHSECLTGDVFGSLRCDCGDQLAESCRRITAEGAGVILYLRQEGRGIGLGNKLRAYALQDEGLDTVDANLTLGFAADERDFAVAAGMLKALQISSIRLLTNNPEKLEVVARAGITILERVSLIVPIHPYADEYVSAKRTKLGHLQ